MTKTSVQFCDSPFRYGVAEASILSGLFALFRGGGLLNVDMANTQSWKAEREKNATYLLPCDLGRAAKI